MSDYIITFIGGTLFIDSDGVEDTENDAGEFLEWECKIELLAAPPQSADELVERFSSTLESFMGDAKPFDDVMVLMIMNWKWITKIN